MVIHLMLAIVAANVHGASILDDKTATTIVVFHRSGRAENFVLSPAEARPIGVAVVEASKASGVPREILLGVIEQETGYLARRSSADARGLMQLRSPATDAWCPPASCNPDDPHDNVAAGAAYLAFLKFRFGSWTAALTAYNRGPAAFLWSGRKISPYARSVMHRTAAIRAALRRAAHA